MISHDITVDRTGIMMNAEDRHRFILDELIHRAEVRGSLWKGDTIQIHTEIIRGFVDITDKFKPISDSEAVLLYDLEDIIAMKEMEEL